MGENKFKNVIDITPEKEHKHKFKNTVIIPFISGIIGCSLVIGTCFGVPSIKEKIIGTSSEEASSASATPSANLLTDSTAGTVDFVSLESYSDTAVYAANKILPSIVGVEVTYNVKQRSMFGMFGNSGESTTTTTG